LDLPKVLDGGQQPIYCVRRGHQGFGTRLKALEYTYYPQVKSGFDGAVSASGAVVGSGYRNDIDTPLPNEFFQSFEPLNEGQGWLYALYLFEGTQSKLVAKAVSLLPGQRRKLKDLIEDGLRLVLEAPRKARRRPSLASLMKRARGVFDSGVPDLGSNPKHSCRTSLRSFRGDIIIRRMSPWPPKGRSSFAAKARLISLSRATP